MSYNDDWLIDELGEEEYEMLFADLTEIVESNSWKDELDESKLK